MVILSRNRRHTQRWESLRQIHEGELQEVKVRLAKQLEKSGRTEKGTSYQKGPSISFASVRGTEGIVEYQERNGTLNVDLEEEKNVSEL